MNEQKPLVWRFPKPIFQGHTADLQQPAGFSAQRTAAAQISDTDFKYELQLAKSHIARAIHILPCSDAEIRFLNSLYFLDIWRQTMMSDCVSNAGFDEGVQCICRCERRPECPQPNRTVLKCGTPGAVTLPLATVAGTSFTLATVNVDTRGFRRPCIKFEFASNIVTTAAVLTLNFQVFKQCKNQLTPQPVSPIWTFSRLVAVTEADSFTFFACDCDICDEECCTYSVVATVAGVATVGVTAINNATLSAILVDNSDCGCGR